MPAAAAVNPWRCQSVDDEDDARLPLLALRSTWLQPRAARRPIDAHLTICPKYESYIVKRPRDAYWIVLLRGCCTGETTNVDSIVGDGHLERANAWTHLIGALVFATYALVRAVSVDQHTLTAQLSGLSCVLIAIMFGVSTVFHTYNTVPGCASIVRNADIIAIYVSIAGGMIADSALVTNDFYNVPFHTMADPLLAACALVFFFSLRRWFVPREETRDFQFEDSCSLGLFRFFHSDLEHAGLRVAGAVTLTLSWILLVSAAFNNLNGGVAAVWLTGVVFATVLLVSGVVFDNLMITDNAYANNEQTWYKCSGCSSKSLGCAMTSHTWWHVISFVAVVITTFAREYGLIYH